jgi:hypothetical protein
MKTEDRVLRLENAFSTLVELARTQSERLTESKRQTKILIELGKTQNGCKDKYERRTEGLAQAQKELVEVQKELAKVQKELAEAQKQTEANLSTLTIAVADLERALKRLARRFDKHIGDN